MVAVGYGGLSQLRGLTGSRDECSLFLENTFNFQIMHHQCAVCIINVLYALLMCCMHYQCATVTNKSVQMFSQILMFLYFTKEMQRIMQ